MHIYINVYPVLPPFLSLFLSLSMKDSLYLSFILRIPVPFSLFSLSHMLLLYDILTRARPP